MTSSSRSRPIRDQQQHQGHPRPGRRHQHTPLLDQLLKGGKKL